ncbi:MAG: pantoate--beta-alanine ligase [Pseudomonadota bacterium]|nr:pantoate--beta-alanine ligase [Pseudomonadota bacterium]
MEVIHTVRDLRRRLAGEGAVGLVPTMGSLHEGHLSLVRSARTLASCVVTSVFVNRLQFGPGEDFERYPRDLSEDTRLLGAAGCQVVFAPDESEMYPVPQRFLVEPPELQHELEGAIRPGHFRGVCTVVLKLINMVHPQVALFGKKDYQQWTLLREMVGALSLPVRMVSGETMRADDGLALSSRNAYLSPEQRSEAPRLQRVLRTVAAGIKAGAARGDLLTAASAELAAHGWQVDYLALRRQSDLAPPQPGERALVLLAAARLGGTRLIDNLEVLLPEA